MNISNFESAIPDSEEEDDFDEVDWTIDSCSKVISLRPRSAVSTTISELTHFKAYCLIQNRKTIQNLM
jgi:hypothetical protein